MPGCSDRRPCPRRDGKVWWEEHGRSADTARFYGKEDRQGITPQMNTYKLLLSHSTCFICSFFVVNLSTQGTNYKEGLTPVLSLMAESSRYHREIRRYLKTQVQGSVHALCNLLLSKIRQFAFLTLLLQCFIY